MNIIMLLFYVSNMDYNNKPKFNRQISFRGAYESMSNSMDQTHDKALSTLDPPANTLSECEPNSTDKTHDDTLPTLIPTITLPAITLPECKNNTCEECQTSKKLEETFQIEKQRCSML